MTKYAAIIVLVLRLIYQPGYAQVQTPSFTSPSPLPESTTSIFPAKLISVNAGISNNKVILNWIVGENETADQFEIEKSTDGKNFTMAALVFGTDKPQTGSYQFYEKVIKQKTLYRIKLIDKNKKTEYSRVIEVDPDI